MRQIVREVYCKEFGIKPRRERIKFSYFADIYVRDHAEINKRSCMSDIYMLVAMTEFFADLYLDEITSQLIERFKRKRLEDGVKESSVNRDLALLKKMFNLAVDWNHLEVGLLPKIKMFQEKDNFRERVLSYEEEQELLICAPSHLKDILIVALNTGMRKGEILSLCWSHVDFQKEEIRVEKTKSGKPRTIPMNRYLHGHLSLLKKKTAANKVFVFVNPQTGKPFTDIANSFCNSCRKAEILGLRFHDLRHTFATRLVEKGVNLVTISNLLGHSSVKITERYTHPDHELKRSAVETLGNGEIAKKGFLNIFDSDRAGDGDRLQNHLLSNS